MDTKTYNKIYYEAHKEERKVIDKLYRIANKEKIHAQKKLYREKNKDKIRTSRSDYYKANKKKLIDVSRAYYLSNKEKIKEYFDSWKKANPEKTKASALKYYNKNSSQINAYTNKWIKEKLKTDPKFKLNHNTSTAIRASLKNGKNGRTWSELVGYSVDDLKKHLEKQFTDGMTWDNYGRNGWHIDHKIPISVFNFTKPEHADFKKCWALKNLQPMWEGENISKSNKITKHFQPSLLL